MLIEIRMPVWAGYAVAFLAFSKVDFVPGSLRRWSPVQLPAITKIMRKVKKIISYAPKIINRSTIYKFLKNTSGVAIEKNEKFFCTIKKHGL